MAVVQSTICHSSLVVQSASDGVTYKRAEDTVPQELFRQNGTLDDQFYASFPSINNNLVAFAISRDLGTIQATQDSITWAMGYITDPVIDYRPVWSLSPTKLVLQDQISQISR